MPTTWYDTIRYAQTCHHVQWQGVMSHFACADEPNAALTAEQLRQLEQLDLPAGWQRCWANSAALLQDNRTHADWVRAGLSLYGISPCPEHSASTFGLRAAMTLRTEVLAIRELNAGQSAGYGAHFVAPSTGRLATIALGYGDGFPRAIRSGTVPVRIGECRFPLVGRIAMDMAMVWLGQETHIQAGDTVTIWGDEHPIEIVASAADTIPYTLSTMLTARVPRRIYHG